MGFGGKFFAFPWKTISYCKGQDSFILNVEKDRLAAKEGFDKDRWPDIAQAEWQNKVNNYYNSSVFETTDI